MKYPMDVQVQAVMAQAEQEARELGNSYVGSEHVLLALSVCPQGALAKALHSLQINHTKMKQDLRTLFGVHHARNRGDTLVYSQVVEDILEKAMQRAKAMDLEAINNDCLLMALLETRECVAAQLLERYDLDIVQLLDQLCENSRTLPERFRELRDLTASTHGRDLAGRKQELALMIAVLLRKDKANPLLVGEAGVGKSALVEYLAWQIAQGNIPQLRGCHIYELHLNTLVAGTRYRGDFEEKLQNIIDALLQYPDVIVFIDEIHQIIGAGKSEGSIDVSSVLKPYLARGELRCIGATTQEEYEMFLAKDRALERRFQLIMIKEPSKEETLRMLQEKKAGYERYHQVEVPKELLPFIVSQSDYYLADRHFPDKAMDVLDLACVQAKTAARTSVNTDDVRQVMEKLTGLPVHEHDWLPLVQTALSKAVYGQKEVIAQIMRQLHWLHERSITKHALAVWAFYGKQGVGKHTTAQTLATAYFHTPLLQLDMQMADVQLELLIRQLKRTPSGVLVIDHLEKAGLRQLAFLQHALQQGYMEWGEQKAPLHHCIVIFMLQEDEQKQDPLRFHEQKAASHPFLPKELSTWVEESIGFAPLPDKAKLQLAKDMLQQWQCTMDEEQLRHIITSVSDMQELHRELKRHAVYG